MTGSRAFVYILRMSHTTAHEVEQDTAREARFHGRDSSERNKGHTAAFELHSEVTMSSTPDSAGGPGMGHDGIGTEC